MNRGNAQERPVCSLVPLSPGSLVPVSDRGWVALFLKLSETLAKKPVSARLQPERTVASAAGRNKNSTVALR
jgi:hypothetical protein